MDKLTQEAVSGYIGMYYYTAVANVFAQAHLPHITTFNPTIEIHNLIKTTLDNSFTTFEYLDNLLDGLDKNMIDINPISSWYYTTKQYWKNSVKNATDVFNENCE